MPSSISSSSSIACNSRWPKRRRSDGTTRVDPGTGEYLAGQLSALRAQYAGGQPNADIVSAALGAALVVLERLGPSVVNPQDVQALAAFGPSLTVSA